MENPLLVVLESVVEFMEHSNGPRKYARAAREALDEMKMNHALSIAALGLKLLTPAEPELPQDSPAELPPEAERSEAE